jgi:hypothetical protein
MSGMSFLWWAAPLVAALVYALTGWRDKRREAEIERWRKQMGPGAVVRKEAVGDYRSSKEVGQPGPGAKEVPSMPGPLHRALASTGGGAPLAYFELVSKIAYLACVEADAVQGSDHQTVVTKLDEQCPVFTARPLPIVEGERVPNTGVQFKKDAEFMELYLVERGMENGVIVPASEALDKEIRKWLSPPVRAALLDFPDAWLRVDGKAKTMAITLYGPADAERINELITCADVIFAEYGAEGGPSLFGDEDEEPQEEKPAPPPKKSSKKKGASQKSA